MCHFLFFLVFYCKISKSVSPRKKQNIIKCFSRSPKNGLGVRRGWNKHDVIQSKTSDLNTGDQHFTMPLFNVLRNEMVTLKRAQEMMIHFSLQQD